MITYCQPDPWKKIKSNSNLNTNIFIEENASEIVCKLATMVMTCTNCQTTNIWTTYFLPGVGSREPPPPGRGMLVRGLGMPHRCGDCGRPGDACRAALPTARCRCWLPPPRRGGESRGWSRPSLPWCWRAGVLRREVCRLGRLRRWSGTAGESGSMQGSKG